MKRAADDTTEEKQGNRLITTYGHEPAYCMEHSIHHQVLIKAGLIRFGQHHLMDENSDIVYSIPRYRSDSCVQ